LVIGTSLEAGRLLQGASGNELFNLIVAKKRNTRYPPEFPLPEKPGEVDSPSDPEEPLIPEEEPDMLPEEEPFETPPYEVPPPEEGP
jgi:hypothetical protein